MNKVYLVMEYYWNGEHYEDFEEKATPVKAFELKEEAEKFINAMPVPVKELQYDAQEEPLECEETVLWDVDSAIRAFALRNKYGEDRCYAYYILEVPFGKEEEDEQSTYTK